ncbi:hypothetical protein Ancab_026942 [Ancistrocladus abbreviatus]
MASNLNRQLVAFLVATQPKLQASGLTPEWVVTRSILNKVSRLISSSTEQEHQANLTKETEEPKQSVEAEAKAGQNEEGGGGEDKDDGEYVNKVTGEIGGPRGPEPTRYGDWEKGGRCYDF